MNFATDDHVRVLAPRIYAGRTGRVEMDRRATPATTLWPILVRFDDTKTPQFGTFRPDELERSNA